VKLGAPFETTEYTVSKVVSHASYNEQKMRNNIALIQLEVKKNPSTFEPIDFQDT
jgi:hypothetical protein